MTSKKYIIKFKGRYYYFRRIPAEMKEFDKRTFIKIGLKTDSRDSALKNAALINTEIELYWKKLAEAGQPHTNAYFQQTLQFARNLGYTYLPHSQLVEEKPISELVERITEIEKANLNKRHTEALFGGVPAPVLTVSEALNSFWTLSKDRVMNKTEDQCRKWKNPRIKAFNNFIKVVGDKSLKEITRDDIIKFKDWWIDRIKAKEMNTSTANKDLIHLKNVLEIVSGHHQLNIDIQRLFYKIMLGERFKKKRRPLKTEDIHTLLTSDYLNRLDEQARWFLFAMSETGARPSEIVGLLPEDIILNDKIPHIKIVDRPTRPLKTAHSARTIPLVGYAYDAMIANPDGFPRYRDKPDNLSNILNRFLREHKLLPSENHSVYSLRHSFQDRLLKAKTFDRIQADLMGHQFDRPNYGDGAILSDVFKIMKKVQVKKRLT